MKPRAPESYLVPIALFLIALLVRVAFARLTGFDGLYGQDPFAYYDYSIRLRETLLALQPAPPFFWPLGYPLLVAATMLLVGIRPLAGQLVCLIAGAFVTVAVFGLTREARRACSLHSSGKSLAGERLYVRAFGDSGIWNLGFWILDGDQSEVADRER